MAEFSTFLNEFKAVQSASNSELAKNIATALNDTLKKTERRARDNESKQNAKKDDSLEYTFRSMLDGLSTINTSVLSMGTILSDIRDIFSDQFDYEKQRDENQLKKELSSSDDSTTVTPTESPDDNKKGPGLLAMLAGGLGAGALALGKGVMGAAGGIASMGLAISAFFGGLVVGNEALGVAKEAGFDFDFKATKAAAKGFSEIVQELSPEAMVSLAGILAAGSIASIKGGKGTEVAKSVAAMGIAISAFFGGLLVGDKILEGISVLTGGADFEGFKSVVRGFNSVIAEMDEATMLVIGTLLGAAAVASFKTPLKGQALGISVASMGLAISGFFAGLVAGNALLENVDILSGSLALGGMKEVVKGFGEIVNELTPGSIAILGTLLAAGAALGFTNTKNALNAAIGMTAVGAGMSGFFVGLAAGDVALSWMGSDYSSLPALTKNFSESISNLTDKALITLAALLGAGGLVGALGGPAAAGGMALGMGAIGAGIAAFFAAFAAADFVAGKIGDGSSIKTLVQNFSEAISSLDTKSLIALGSLIAVGGIFGAVPGGAAVLGGAAVGMGLVGAGIAAFFLSFEGLAKVASIIGVDGSNTKVLLTNMSAGLQELAKIDGANLLSVAGGLAALGPAMLLMLGSEGIAGLAGGITDAVKGAWSWLTGKDDEGGEKQTVIQKMVEMLKPVEELNDINLDGFVEASNALTDFVNNDYVKGADDFEYFVNKIVDTMPKLSKALIEGPGLATSKFYIKAAENIQLLRTSLSEIQTNDDRNNQLMTSVKNGMTTNADLNDQRLLAVNNTNIVGGTSATSVNNATVSQAPRIQFSDYTQQQLGNTLI